MAENLLYKSSFMSNISSIQLTLSILILLKRIKVDSMEGKSLIMSALLLSLVLGQMQVEAKSCCPSTTARNIYNACRLTGASRPVCASASGCRNQDPPCPSGWQHILENNAGANEFCKLGCSSSVCGAIISLHESDASEVVSGAAEKCNKACSAICAKAPLVEIA